MCITALKMVTPFYTFFFLTMIEFDENFTKIKQFGS